MSYNKSLGRNMLASCCVLAAVYLAASGNGAWGWFLFAAVIIWD